MSIINVMCIGAQKAGTTSLYEILKKHPDIELSDIKEVYYFTDDKLYGKIQKLNRHYKFNPDKTIYMNITPNYLCDTEALSRIKKYNPDMKIIVILRNPIDRLYSQYNMNKRMNKEKRPFSNFFYDEKDLYEKGLKTECNSSIYRSLYVLQLKKVYHYFSKEQVLIINFNDFVHHQKDTVNTILQFMNLSTFQSLEPYNANPHFTPRIKWLWYLYTKIPFRLRRYIQITFRSFFSVTSTMKKITEPSEKEAINPKLKEELIHFFQPYNRELQPMLTFDISDWDV